MTPDPIPPVRVGSYADTDHPKVSGRERDRIARVLSDPDSDPDAYGPDVVWCPEWVSDDPDKNVAFLSGSERLLAGTVDDYSDKAWRLRQYQHEDGRGVFLPKSQVVVFRLADGVESIDTPQAGLGGFA